MPDKKGFWALLINAIFLGTYGIWVRFLQQAVTGYQQVTLRSVIALFFAICTLLFLKTPWNVQKKHAHHLFLYLFCFAISTVLFTLAVIQTSIALSVFGLYVGSLLSAFILGFIFFQESLSFSKIMSAILVLLALFAFTYPFSLKILNIGFIIGIGAGIFDGIGNAFKKYFGGKIERPLLIVLQIFATLIVGLSLSFFSHQSILPQSLSFTTMINITMYSIIFFAVAYLSMYGFQHFDLNLGTIIISSELFWAPFFAFLLFHETLSGHEALGGILVSLAILIPYMPLQYTKKLPLRKILS